MRQGQGQLGIETEREKERGSEKKETIRRRM